MRSFLILALMMGAPVAAQSGPVCASAKACADIVSRHGPHEFDYAALADSYLRLDPRAFQSLAEDPQTADRAFQVARVGDGRLANVLLSRWPQGVRAALIDLAAAQPTPLIRNRMISTLNVLDLADDSREGLAALPPAALTADVPAAAFDDLARAAIEAPTPEIVSLLAAVDRDRAAPILARIVKTGDPAVAATALQGLYDASPDRAMVALWSSPKPAHIAWMADARVRPDLADLGTARLKDAKTGAERLTALQLAAGDPRNRASLTASDLAAYLSDPAAPPDALVTLSGGDPDVLARLWLIFPESRMAMLSAIPPGSASLALSRLMGRLAGEGSDYRVQLRALDFTGSGEPALDRIAQTHPVDAVRAKAARRQNRPAPNPATCRLTGQSPTDYRPQMPFFSGGRFADGSPVIRAFLGAALPIRDGWLAGYRAGPTSSGGAVAYANADGFKDVVSSAAVSEIHAIQPIAAGRRADAAWIFTPSDQAVIISRYLSGRPNRPASLDRIAVLPQPDRTLRGPDGAILLDYRKGQSPLRLDPAGQITRACTPASPA